MKSGAKRRSHITSRLREADAGYSNWKAIAISTRMPATRGLSAGERFVHDAADSPGASPALGAAAKAVIDFAGSARRSLVTGKSRPDVVVSEHVAGADDHRTKVRRCNYFRLGRVENDFNQKVFFLVIPT